jgi:hypothetical protein
MTLSRWSRALPESILWAVRRPRRPVRIGGLVALILALVVAASPATLAQVRPEVLDRVLPAVVQILIVGEVTENGVTEPQVLATGSGAIVSASGQILTAWHVVDMAAHRRVLDARATQAAAEGRDVSIKLEEVVLIATSDGITAPQPRYIASISASNPVLDLAVLQVVGDDTGPLDSASLNLPFVPLGDSDALHLGDPGMAGGALTYTGGVVSAFHTEGQIERAWLLTDAEASGGSSGGPAVTREGALVGILTDASMSPCVPTDTNGDGRIDEQDTGCATSGGSLARLRPGNLARPLLGGLPLPPPPAPPSLPLPDALPLPHAGCFHIDSDSVLTYEDLVSRLGGTDEARSNLQRWGWQASVNRTFACDTPPDGEAGWVDISLHRFADSTSAQQAVDYFAAVRAEGSTLFPAEPPALGDHAAVLSGPTSNGKEFTLYVSQGPLLIRVTGVSRSGIPFINVLTVVQSILASPVAQVPPAVQPTSPQDPSQPAPPSAPLQPASAFLPAAPAVRYAECFQVFTRGTYTYPEVVGALQEVGLSRSQIDALGWQDGAFVVFRCAEPPYGRASQLDVVIHQFRDPQAAQQALPSFDSTYVPGVNEMRDCDGAGALVICVTGRSLTGSPLSDVAFVLQQVVGSTR